MSTNEAAEWLRKYMRDDDWDHGITLLDEALAHERSAGAAPLDVDLLADALRHVVVRSRFTHEFAESLSAEYARLEGSDR